MLSLVTTQLTRLLEAGVDLLPLRAILVGGGPVPDDVLAEAIGRGRDGRADLRPHRGVLAGDDARAVPGRSASSAPPAGRC